MTLRPFLPSHLERALATGKGAPIPRRDVFPAALLFADLSGFTALTERLQRRGREGAEEITDVLRTAFRPVLGAVRRSGGSVVSFGGDAVFALFDGTSCALRALRAARRIQVAYGAGWTLRTSVGRVTLRLSQAVHHGHVHGLHLGTAERAIYVVTGAPVVALARQQAATAPGALSVSPAARRRARAEPPVSRSASPEVEAPPEILLPYVPSHVRTGAGTFHGEYRRAAMTFLETSGAGRGALQRFALRLHAVLDRYEGILVGTDLSPHGIKWLCAFGAPVPHEDDALRAGQAALEATAPMRGLRVRSGTHAGVLANIWVGTSWRRSYELIGDVTNTAARAMALAPWGEAVATAGLVALARDLQTRPRGRHVAKGKAEPLELHAIEGTRRVGTDRGPVAPLLGREREMTILRAALRGASGGQGRAIAIRGDAGLGKSRLKYEISRIARAEGFEVHEARALPFGGGPCQAALDLLREKLGIRNGASTAVVRSRLARFSARHALPGPDRTRLQEMLLTAPVPEAALRLDPGTMRSQRASSFARAALASRSPQLLILEDLQWADPTSQALVAAATAGAPASSTVLLLLHRPGYEPPPGTQRLPLRELSRRDVRKLLRAILGHPSRRVEDLVAGQSGGNPFYVEEVSRHLLETGVLARHGSGLRLVRRPRTDDLPPTVESVIASRLSRLSPPAKRLCQVGAVIGRTFPASIVARRPELAGRTVEALDELVARELVFQTGSLDRREYIFKHALTRDVAYASILVARRRALHRWVAGQLKRGRAGAGTALALQAHHREQAGEIGEALACYATAAKQAAATYVHDDAIRLYRKYLALARRETPRSLAVRLALGGILHRTGSFDDGCRELERVVRSSSGSASRPLRLRALIALGDLELERNRFGVARAHYDAALQLARGPRNRERRASALLGLGRVAIQTARLADAEQMLAEAAGLFATARNRPGEARVLARLAIVRDGQGRKAEATPLLERALAIHRDTGDRAAEGEVLGFLGASWTHRGYSERGAGYFRQALHVARELGNRRLEGMWLNNLGIAIRSLGQLPDASASFEQAAKIFRSIGARSFLGQVLGHLGSVRGDQGRYAEAAELVRQALRIHRTTGDRLSEAQTLGDLATLLARQGMLSGAASAEGRSAALARALDHVGLELGAVRRLVGHLRVIAPRGRRIAAALSRGEALMRGTEADEARFQFLCERGLAALARQRSAANEIAQCEDLARRLRIDDAHDATAAFRRLARAQTRFAAGEPLHHGMHPDDVAPEIRLWERARAPVPTA